jgi:hypothetical protein
MTYNSYRLKKIRCEKKKKKGIIGTRRGKKKERAKMMY